MFGKNVFSFLVMALFGFFLMGSPGQLHAFGDFEQADLKNFAESFQFDKGQVSQMIDLLERSGQITSEQAREAKQELEGYSDDDINALREQAVQRIEGASSVDELLPKNMIEQGKSSGALPSNDDEIDYREVLKSLNP